MIKWEYRSISIATYDWNANETKRVAFEINTSQEVISLSPDETKVMRELNQLGRQGWEVISVNYDRLPDGVIVEYFLKRPLAE